ncbi:PTS transporter subunit EIIC [Vibrio gazogenes]|uniref:PTS system, beta-glucosides-specific IIC component n=1 Tax=Vibrio gazogenes DSM 21264 = NBRC 103151 TaxID=1123492 RepID=A0A1M4Z901_VIBGA|nr:PTS transporter subunit EIIC [Vibrio gazogenes]USP12483.1 PTS transporter subunit EIIC [Vibrio gazogenes]SHF14465.1 PTS system, beta-glucosides-specific IIC component [Vibrio gazogenes DSM 21264] [Vibrio gazogenes DSM 21264 = NBRC 103151]SJN53915.1 PTS system beta-glucoside-specific EIIBCA component [Vibrio gazogenes]
MNYENLTKSILEYVGGKENISSALHCSTRLRLELKNSSNADLEKIKTIPGVMGAVYSGGQCQIIIGNNVSTVFQNLTDSIGGSIEKTEIKSEKMDLSFKGIFNKFAAVVTGIFQPIIPAIAASGMLKALLLLSVSLELTSKTSQFYLVMSFIADAAFYFLPLLLAFSCAQKFKTNPFVSVALAGVLIHPKLIALMGSGTPIDFIGFHIPSVSYASSVLPIIFSIWLMSYIEPLADKVSPGAVKIFMKPLLVLVIVAPIALIILGPLGNYLGQGLSSGVFWVQSKVGWLAVALLSIFMPLIVMFGMHKVFYPIIFAAMASPGYETLIHSAMLSSNIAQGAGALTVWFMAKDVSLKQIALPAGISALFGITEPALYGIHLKLKRPLLGCMVGAGCAGSFAGLVTLKAYAPVGPGLASLPMWIGEGNNFYYALITLGISLIVTPIAVTLIGFDEK